MTKKVGEISESQLQYKPSPRYVGGVSNPDTGFTILLPHFSARNDENMNWLRFGHSGFLYFLWAVPPLILMILFGLRQKRKAILRFHTHANPTYFRSHTVQAGLLILSYVFVTLAIARPQFGAKPEPVAERLDVMLALDISTSMLAADIKPNRLHHAKSIISTLLERLEGNRIGLLHFAEASFVVCPLTTDTSTLKEFLAAIAAETLPHSSTRIGNAIEIATARLGSDALLENAPTEKQTDAASPIGEISESRINHKVTRPTSSGQKALILFTDGEDHGEEAVAAAKAAHQEGVYIYCIGVGAPNQPVPIPLAGAGAGYKRDVNGQLVLTALDEALLRNIAKTGHGTYYHASADIARLTADLARLEGQKFRVTSKGEYQERFQLFVGIALILLVSELLLEKRINWKGRTD